VPTIAILEDTPESLAAMLRALSTPAARKQDWGVSYTTERCEQMIEWLRSNAVDVLISDLGLPDLSGLHAVQFCKTTRPSTEILGANGYLLKADIDTTLLNSVAQLIEGGSPMSPRIARRVLLQLHPPVAPEIEQPSLLTPKELQVLALIARGFKYGEIAELQKLSTHTVHTHLKNIYKKLQVSSKSEAIFEARQQRYID
jgi:DNA-binding NarL/FixJ family response regulator